MATSGELDAIKERFESRDERVRDTSKSSKPVSRPAESFKKQDRREKFGASSKRSRMGRHYYRREGAERVQLDVMWQGRECERDERDFSFGGGPTTAASSVKSRREARQADEKTSHSRQKGRHGVQSRRDGEDRERMSRAEGSGRQQGLEEDRSRARKGDAVAPGLVGSLPVLLLVKGQLFFLTGSPNMR